MTDNSFIGFGKVFFNTTQGDPTPAVLGDSMTVAQLIEFLKTQPQDLLVAYKCCSEQVLLERNEIKIERLCAPRLDGWLQNARPDMPAQDYLVFPGN